MADTAAGTAAAGSHHAGGTRLGNQVLDVVDAKAVAVHRPEHRLEFHFARHGGDRVVHLPVAEHGHDGHHGHEHHDHHDHAEHVGHAGHDHSGHAGHDHSGHAGHDPAVFKRKFWLTLVLTIPTLVFSQGLQEILGLDGPRFPGSQYIPAIFGVAIFFYGGLVFLRGAVDELKAKPTSPQIAKFLGATPGMGKGLGLPDDWAYNLIKKNGNYSEIFERNLGPSTPLAIERGLNAQWTDGGLLYAMPYR